MQQDYKPHEIERKWQKQWDENRIFEADPDSRNKFFITVPYPYLNGNLHAGHTRTFTIGDVVARHKRMQGYNVLYPMGFHVTGTPLVGLAELIKKQEPKTMEVYSKYHGIPKYTLENLDTPEKIVDYFTVEAEQSMRSIGYSIDWRRKFTTTGDAYKKFIEWQFNLLYKKGYIVKGSHPVKWCPSDDNPVEDHDILHGEGANIVDYTFIKFKYDDVIIPCATLRPETIFGVTNLWVNPDIEHVKVKVKKEDEDEAEYWIVSKRAYTKLRYTEREVEYIEDVSAKSLIGIKAENPVTGDKVISLPASFVTDEYGSGIVMSVPAHAPYDYLALRDMYDKDLSEYGIDENPKDIEFISLIDIPDYGKYPAVEAVEEYDVSDQNDPRAEDATRAIYRKEFHNGVLKDITGKYANIEVSKIKDILTQDLIERGIGEILYEFSEPVVCRCGTPCVVKMVRGQWFLNYSDPEWKNNVYRCIDQMNIIPPEYRNEFKNKVDWLKDKACARKKGLGTRLPFDSEWLIESLADSTIYMAYYIIGKFVQENLTPKHMVPEMFDYVILGKGDSGEVADKSGISRDILEQMRYEFEYWYPVDLRSSGKDLVPNHLLFFLFHHVAIFDEDKWPQAIAVNGFVSLEGQKMSKSKGPLLTLNDAVESYGADVSRVYILSNAEQTQDADWRASGIEATKKQIDRFYNFAKGIINSDISQNKGELHQIDRWMLSRLQHYIEETNNALDTIKTRNAIQNSFFFLSNDVKWYQRRGGNALLYDILDVWVRLMSPFAPHICEEIWESMRHKESDFVSLAAYPDHDPELIDNAAELGEDLISCTLSDIEEIIKVTKINPRKIVIYTSPEWKIEAYHRALSMHNEGNLNIGNLMKNLMQDPEIKSYGKEVQKFVQKIAPNITSMDREKFDKIYNANLDEESALKENLKFFEKETGCTVEIENADNPQYDPDNKSKYAIPLKPAIYIE
ncbi:MAG: leucine--tRNA ligase [Methanohalobium sp.]|uniref:leucine--tRNA ligase n=1 Tax=Methanohalobium sp. TaxID=2837493 RepID=UPI00397882C0